MSESEPFFTELITLIQGFYDNRCAFCLDKLVADAGQCVDILDTSDDGESQLEIIPRDYRRQSLENGILLCARCHQVFIHDYIALCPPKEVLEYILKYVKDTPIEEQMPLYQVFGALATHNRQGLPDPSAILPYIGLYSNLKPKELQNVTITTSFFPPMYILSNGLWESPGNPPNQSFQTVSTGTTAAHIFDALGVNTSRQRPSPGLIPLHSDQPQHSYKLYWRLQNASLGGILSSFISRGEHSLSLADELEMAKDLHRILTLRRPRGVVAEQSGAEQNITISTSFFPPISILSDGLWEKAPNETVSTGATAAHIFDALAVNASRQHPSPGLIPLHSDQPQHSRKLYWRLQNASLGGILSSVILRGAVSSSLTDEVKMVKKIRTTLSIRKSRGVPTEERGERGGKRGGKARQQAAGA